MPFIKKIIDKLIKKNISISVAESCTGGLIANTITKYSGVSKISSARILNDSIILFSIYGKKASAIF